MQKNKGKQQWCQEQRKLLTDLFPKYTSKKWKMISLQMAEKGFKRTQLECRQKWINFLDPNLNNEEWRQEELQKLYNFHDKYGTRWCFMQKQLNRTQNRIKNRFYGAIRNYIRLVLNTLCQRNTCFNTEINKISPSLLNDLYNSENIFDFLRGEIKKMIYRMKFKIDKKILRNRIRQKENLYRELLGLISSLFKGSFSLKFLDQIDKEDQNNDLIDQRQESIEQIQKQIFQVQNKTVNKQEEQVKLKKQHLNLQAYSEQKTVYRQRQQPYNLNYKEGNILDYKIIKQPQSLYANNKNLKQAKVVSIQNNNRGSREVIESRKPQIYPFLSYPTPSQIMEHNIMMNNLSKSIGYDMNIQHLINKIKYQNMMIIQRQRQDLMNQLIANSQRHI